MSSKWDSTVARKRFVDFQSQGFVMLIFRHLMKSQLPHNVMSPNSFGIRLTERQSDGAPSVHLCRARWDLQRCFTACFFPGSRSKRVSYLGIQCGLCHTFFSSTACDWGFDPRISTTVAVYIYILYIYISRTLICVRVFVPRSICRCG